MGRIELAGGVIDYGDTGGDGPVVVFVHGLLMDESLWRDVLPALASDHRCVTPVLPIGAHRQPMHPDADLSMAGQVQLILELIEQLGLSEVTLAGVDWGAPIAVAAERDPRITRLVLGPMEAFDNIPPGLPGKVAGISRAHRGLLAAQGMRIPALRRLPLTFGWMSKRPVPRDMFDQWMLPTRKLRGVRRDVSKYVRTTDFDCLNVAATKLGEFTGPVTIVWSRDDKVMPFTHAERLAELFPRGRLVEIDDSYVLVPIDQPAAFARAIRETTSTAASLG